MKIKISKKTKEHLSRNEIDQILALVTQLPRASKRRYILKKIEKIGIAKINNKIISIACIKKPSTQYREKIKKLSNISQIEKKEMGYCFTNPRYRGQHIGHKVFRKVLEKNCFLTVAEANIGMQKIAEQNGFRAIGNTYKSSLDDYNIKIYSNTNK